jgi:dihydroneopterin aldolase
MRVAMSEEVSIAFAPLEARTADHIDPPDRISVRDHVVEVEIGAFQVERDMTQRLRFSVVVEVAPSQGALSDDVDDILSYDSVTEAIEAELAAERLNLLETLAQRIADRILREPQPLRVFVRIEKLDRGPGNLGVEIVRNRQEKTVEQHETSSGNLVVVFIEPSQRLDPEFTKFLDRLDGDASAYVLCVGHEDERTTKAVSASATAQRHIDLLALEQDAWRFHAADPRCVVVGTKTELDWGMKNNQISVWAPSKLVVDAVDGPQDIIASDLAIWFADQIGATELICLSPTQGLQNCPISMRTLSLRDAP